MKKKNYIQPETGIAVMPKYAMMWQSSPTINPVRRRDGKVAVF